ncbi:unnamed protein product [Sphagnum troendelagicum]|uniref:Uncharacterized protein n=1 Tax=Sphagnum troendelagicum TaxID=128251 RepID=A0ABP0TG89_9BRYO
MRSKKASCIAACGSTSSSAATDFLGKERGAQTGARSLRADVERPGGEDDPKKTRVIESAGKLAVNWASARVSRLRLAYISSVFLIAK